MQACVELKEGSGGVLLIVERVEGGASFLHVNSESRLSNSAVESLLALTE
jgi:hypothetical protein